MIITADCERESVRARARTNKSRRECWACSRAAAFSALESSTLRRALPCELAGLLESFVVSWLETMHSIFSLFFSSDATLSVSDSGLEVSTGGFGCMQAVALRPFPVVFSKLLARAGTAGAGAAAAAAVLATKKNKLGGWWKLHDYSFEWCARIRGTHILSAAVYT